MDDFDRAQRIEELHRRNGLAASRSALHGTAREDCQDCGDPISTARLAAMPNAIRCVRCQDAHERHDRLRGL